MIISYYSYRATHILMRVQLVLRKHEYNSKVGLHAYLLAQYIKWAKTQMYSHYVYLGIHKSTAQLLRYSSVYLEQKVDYKNILAEVQIDFKSF